MAFDDKLGPQGFLGVQPSIFHGRVELLRRLPTKARVTQLEAEFWVSSSQTKAWATQLHPEFWVRDYRQTSQAFDYPKDRMGPQGFLGVVPATFKNRLTLQTSDSQIHPSVGPNYISDDRYGIGPRGFLGIVPRRFREQGLYGIFGQIPAPAQSKIQATHLSAESWVRILTLNQDWATHISAESWVRILTPNQDWSSQLSAEIWIASTQSATSVPAFLWVD